LRKGDGHEELRTTSLLSSDLHDTPSLLDGLAELFALVDGQRQGFLTVDVFARIDRIDYDFRVPVVRCANGHDIDVPTIQQLTIVSVYCTLIAGCESLRMSAIDIGAGNLLAQTTSGVADKRSTPTDTDAPNSQTLMG
jgi:hypothetical protein